MASNAVQIREYYKELLSDGKKHSRTELFEYARSRNRGANYTTGMLTGAVKTLIDGSKEYACVERATYQKVSKESNENAVNYAEDIIEAYRVILETSIDRIKNDVKITPFQMLELCDKDKLKILKVQKCVTMIEEVLKELEN